MRERRGRLAPLLMLAGSIACTGPRDAALHVVPPPPLAELNPGSREEYRLLRQQVGQLDDEGSAADRSRAWGTLGQWHDAYRFFVTARLAYENARSLDPQEPRWPHLLGRLAYREGDNRRAETMWRRTLELQPKQLATTVRLAEALLAQVRNDEAEALFQQAVAQRPSCARARAGLAEIAMRRGDFATATLQLERALADQPNATPLRYQLGVVYRQRGLGTAAAEHLRMTPRTTLQHVPIVLDDPWTRELNDLNESVAAYEERGMKAFRQRRWSAAEKNFRRALAEDPENLKARQNLAHTLLQQDRMAEAMAELQTALAVDPGSPAIHNTLASLLASRGSTNEAEAHLRAALRSDPDHKRALHNLGQMLLRSGRIEDALPVFHRVVELDPRLSPARHGRAVALWLLGRQREAIETLARDLASQPNSRELVSLLARFLATAAERELRNAARALALIEGQGLAAPTVTYAETRAMVLAGLGRHGDASAWQRAALTSLESTNRPRAIARARERLQSYEDGLPVRTSWSPDELNLPIPIDSPRG